MFFVSTSNITKLSDKSNSYSFEYQKNSYFILGCTAVVQEGNIRKTMAARGLVNGRGPRSGRDLVFRCYPPELLLTPPKKKTEADLLGQPLHIASLKNLQLRLLADYLASLLYVSRRTLANSSVFWRSSSAQSGYIL